MYHACLLQASANAAISCAYVVPHDVVLQSQLHIWHAKLERNQQKPPTLELVPSLLDDEPNSVQREANFEEQKCARLVVPVKRCTLHPNIHLILHSFLIDLFPTVRFSQMIVLFAIDMVNK